ncbi:MAG: FAD-binding protein [Myxococcales bacterium]|nr:MAG: FAD-binding protein [Myxococcales bacterium]
MKVVVVGAGFAGVAAAWAARRAGATVTVVDGGPGASSLYCGGVDGLRAGVPEELLSALGLRLAKDTHIATREGVVRTTDGRDSALLDLAPLAGKHVGVVDVPRDDWDGPLLARSFAASDWARSTGTRFELVPLPLLEKGHERRVSSYDFAAGFERPERPAWLAEVLKAKAGPNAWLFGPWLGLTRSLAAELSRATGVPVGEVTSPPGGAAGARFELRRDALLASLAVERVTGRVTEVLTTGGDVTVRLEGGVVVVGGALVVASGGFVGGGLLLSGALSGADPAGFELAIRGLPPVLLRGELAQPVSSLFGVDLAARGRGLLEHVGLPVAHDGRVSASSAVFAAGDVVGPVPPSVGQALESGLRAGAAAAGTA